MAKFHDLKPEKQKAILLMTRQIVDPNAKRMTFEHIAKECGISDRALFDWRMHDKDFQAARKELVDMYASEIVSDAFTALRVQLRKKHNVKAAEVLLKSQGMMIDRPDAAPMTVVNVEVMNKDNVALAEELAHLKSKLSGLEQGESGGE